MYISEKVEFGFILLVLVFCGLSSCKTAKIIKYEHEQSAEFYKNFEFGDSALNAFKVDDILLVVDINKVTHTSYLVWLGLYSDKAGKSINIERAMVIGDGWEKSQNFNRELVLDAYVDDHELFRFDKGLKLFEVDEGDLKSVVSTGGELSLTVFYDVGGGTESITFILKQKVEKQTVFST
ncbi:hypothetical protein [Microbulbifer thermotolerans]|uniref:Lipoprotein n=1 Tax=Microbulbifer thermotolerans TaxID=252514 RepID=A0A143HKQ3_MICTH|nr:hypothetical protein [Microbulbifer thermotolerans]AMX02305.1 hypothetical protein A3224_06655 [Microbulbifer thermotolerans]MCX2781252.1 hypothetical protein [Microbulbifer thermotolerans]MCX2803259.1 hypothetical protein [Microbulbifer thermotolerans]MCX2806663.1 hypothetical protein [Microbulbifer thermotolerans]SFC97299.1 hypothetical protein SAMN05660479_02851 [Microbulbifer thermotolerans]